MAASWLLECASIIVATVSGAGADFLGVAARRASGGNGASDGCGHGYRGGVGAAAVAGEQNLIKDIQTQGKFAALQPGGSRDRAAVMAKAAAGRRDALITDNLLRARYADIEKGIAALGQKAKNNELAVEDMDGGTFTIRYSIEIL